MAQKVISVVIAHATSDPNREFLEHKYYQEHNLEAVNEYLQKGYLVENVHQTSGEQFTVTTFVLSSPKV